MPRSLLPVAALMLNALIWGVSWWPFRQLQAWGLHPLWSTVLVYSVAVVAIVVARPRALGHVLRTPVLWVLVLASGTTNAAFNWGVVIGDVVRVVLLFYLMPLWVVLLARVLLHERFTRLGLVRVALALAGAAVVLQPEGGGHWPLPESLPDWLGVLGGFSFALNNVMLRRESRQPEESRALAMFMGGTLVSSVLASLLASGWVQGGGPVAWPPAPAWHWCLFGLLLAGFFLASNLALQYGAARLPANVTSVVMLTEVVFASASALWLGGGSMTPRLALGGGLILAAALMAAREPAHGPQPGASATGAAPPPAA